MVNDSYEKPTDPTNEVAQALPVMFAIEGGCWITLQNGWLSPALRLSFALIQFETGAGWTVCISVKPHAIRLLRWLGECDAVAMWPASEPGDPVIVP
jgi:hypothetical protein